MQILDCGDLRHIFSPLAYRTEIASLRYLTMAALRIFSYLPNPRVWKATIAGRFVGVEIEIRGAPAKELKSWLWDYDAAPVVPHEMHAYSPLARTGRVGLTGERLFKTEAFNECSPVRQRSRRVRSWRKDGHLRIE